MYCMHTKKLKVVCVTVQEEGIATAEGEGDTRSV